MGESMRLISGSEPPSPLPGPYDRRLVARFGRDDADLLGDFRGVSTPLVCQSLSDARAKGTVAAKAIELGLAIVFDPECEKNQLREADRPKPFRRLDCSLKGRWIGTWVRPGKLASYVRATLEEERGRGAYAFIAPNHMAEGSWSESRQVELALQREAYTYFNSERLSEPSPGDPFQRPRTFLIGATFSIQTLRDPAERRRLIAAHSALQGDAYWVRIAGLRDRADPDNVRAASAFLVGLNLASGRQVIAVGSGNLSLPFLATGLSVCIGFGSHEYFSLPAKPPARRSSGFNWVVFHRPLLRNVSPRKMGDFAHVAFGATRCPCGHHPATMPPGNGMPRRRHLQVKVSE